jgi:hypothetical protein
MQIYWRHLKRGQRLIIDYDGAGQEEEVGGVRETRRGFDAFAKTFGYEPGRAQKGFPSMEDAKQFVEAFRPWELFEGTSGQEVDQEVREEAEK